MRKTAFTALIAAASFLLVIPAAFSQNDSDAGPGPAPTDGGVHSQFDYVFEIVNHSESILQYRCGSHDGSWESPVGAGVTRADIGCNGIGRIEIRALGVNPEIPHNCGDEGTRRVTINSAQVAYVISAGSTTEGSVPWSWNFSLECAD